MRSDRLARMLLSAVIAFALLPAASAAAHADSSFLSFTSEPGDWVGNGETRYYDESTAEFFSLASEDLNSVGVNVTGDTSWGLELAAPAGQVLIPGVYTGAMRAPFQDPGSPGLDFFGDGRGCNTLTGSFEVLEATYGPGGWVEHLHATFEQHCEGGTPALFGEVHINHGPAPEPLALGLHINAKGSTERSTGFATIRGTVTCSKDTTLTVDLYLTQRASSSVLAFGWGGAEHPCMPGTAVPWEIIVMPAGGDPFKPGTVQVNASAYGYDADWGLDFRHDTTVSVKLVRN